MDRFNRLHQPEGFDFGPFKINPRLEVGLGYDTNIFDSDHNVHDDGFVTTTAGASAVASNEDYFAALDGSISRATYFSDSSNDAWYGALSANGWKNVGTNIRLTGNAYVAREIEARDDPQATGETEPVEYWHYRTGIGFETLNALITTSAGIGYDRRDYDNVSGEFGTIDLSERNMNEIDGTTRFTYHIADDRSIYLNLIGNVRLPDDKFDTNDIQRKSSGILATFGSDYTINSAVKLTGEIGYQGQYYVDSDIRDVNGPFANLTASWLLGEFTQVLASFEHAYYESFDVESPGYWQNIGSIGLTQELRRDLVLAATATIADRDFIDSDRNETVYALNANVRWSVANGLIISLENTFEIQEARRDGTDFTSNLTLLHVTKTF